MSATTVNGIDGVKALPTGELLGYSDWVEITQESVNQFADATGDHQWLHVDPERAKDGPFGGPIAHGYLTLSLVPLLLPQVLELSGFSMGVNYGCDRVRFPAPVPVGSKVRAGVVLDSVTDVAGGIQLTVTMTFEIDGGTKPACIATILVRQYP
ncbi:MULTISPECIES: MaoC family dehydratase [unclassified Rhodococcus (in: high G+C Gram-positive bacteria)]|uniref:MaoC family dehydratase n=1 Tax=unclassified Rhodococcus (in: high G+C Gram-positive bacteria) TaxID=192944 RepID=UPI00163B3CF5|nr:MULTISPECIES: MaoC family dehydratase [unclassified Rhodococcus (in: high G+C Gram-positive bacteria)]MBC2644681.1 MaoC family dehydratase [Rhodococcus sp. 3A]MBC2898280.1 MaoC family dehydratase [Rhodococcus sp. 4CII]